MRAPKTVAAIALAVVALLAPLMGPANAGPAHDIAAAQAATKNFMTPGKATADAGYGLLKDSANIACIAMPGMGGMGVHYANPSLVDGTIQLRHPEALVYRFARGGHLKLSAVEYLTPVSAWRTDHPTGRPSLFGKRFNYTPAGNRFGLPAYFSLHAWVWFDNPAGTFKPFNPKVYCPDGI